ncbi:hypothetical protein GQ53DRAFT_617953, partial [Thozetella sp. PMI_491]
CLRSLSFPGLTARQHDIEPAHQHTCDWLFETAEFHEWRHRTDLLAHNGVLWIKGKPGAGKSTLMKHALNYFRRVFQEHLIAAYFFHARGDFLERTPQGMLQSIVYQLLDKDVALYDQFVPIFREQQRIQRERDWRWQKSQLEEFLRSVVEPQLSKPLLLLVDALDECNDDEVRAVVKFLEKLSTKAVQVGVHLKVCLSSRHYPKVTIKKTLELTVETREGHKNDIAIYVDQSLTMADDDIKAEIMKKANGIFMWVVLVVSQLNRDYDEGQVEAMWKTLEDVPDDLEEIFNNYLNKNLTNRSETVHMLQWVLLSKRPLRPRELFAAVVGTSLPTIEIIQRRITASSLGLIEVRESTESQNTNSDSTKSEEDTDEGSLSVQFIHQSVADFLCRNRRLQKLDPTLGPDPISASHSILWARCWSYMEQLNATVTTKEHMI